MSREKSLFKNTIILGIGTFLPRIINLATTPILTSHTSPTDFGHIDLITSTILSFVVPVCTLQLEQALFRFLIDAKTDKEKKTIITSGYALIALIMIVVGVVCLFIPLRGFDGIYKALLIGYIWVEIVNQMSRFVLRAFSMYKEYSIFAAISVIVNFVIVAICFMVLKTGYMGILIALAAADVVALIYVIFSSPIFKFLDVRSFDMDMMKQMLRYSLPFVPNMISWYVNLLSDKWIIAAFLDPGANGIYAAATKIPSIVNILYPAFNLAWTESATRSVEDRDSGKYYLKMYKMIFCVLSGGTACLLAISPYLFLFLKGSTSSYDSAFQYVPTLIVATYFYCFAQFFSSIYIAVKSGKNMSISTTIAAVINMMVNLALVNFIGIQAAVVASLLSNVTLAGYRYFDINKNYYRMKVSHRLSTLTIVVFIIEMILCWLGNPILNVINVFLAVGYAYFVCGDIIKGMLKPMLRRKSS